MIKEIKMKKYGFGVDIGGTTCKIGLFETSGKMLDKWEIPTNKADNGGHILDDVADRTEDPSVISTIDILSEQAERILENNAYFGDPFMGIQKEMPYQREAPKVGRNDPCPCGSGKKYKKCCGK